MKTQKALPAIRWVVPMCLLMLLMGFAPPYGWAQSGAVCGPAPAVKTALEGLPEQTPAQTDWQYHEQRAAAIQALRHEYPGDVFVEKAYIDLMDGRTDKEKVIAEFKARHEQNPDDAKADYLYALALVGRQSPEAIKLLNDALKNDPYFAAPHLQLVSIYSSPVFMDKEQRIAHLKDYLEACPSSVEGYESLTRVDDKDLQRAYAARLRSLITNRTDPDAVGAYTTLWSLEFKLHPPSEYEPLRKQVAQDLESIRQLKLEDKRQWYSALVEGYKLVNDQKQSNLVADQKQTRFPNPWSSPAQSKWWEDHHYPGDDAPPDKKQAYYKDWLQQTAQWVKERPNKTQIWMQRLEAMEHLDDVPTADVLATADQVVKVMMSNAGPEGPSSDDYGNIAEVLSKKHLEPERVVEMAEKGLDKWEIESKEPYYDTYATKENVEDNKFWQAYARLQGLGFETDGYLELKQPDKAQVVLAQIDERLEEFKSLAGDKQDRKKTYSGQLATYWGLMAREAELRGRKLDAMAFYENALLSRLDAQQKPESGMKDDLVDNAHQLWTSLGGSDEGWKLWYGRRADALANLATLTWEDANQPLATFELADLSGKTWTMASLKGKTTFLNFWASW
ncbi:exported hypothetical protein [Acidobacteriia bacterium SbA2]|nr:exported hypothetical protein [Acidobacteriia bacterium SbA2]